LLAVARLFNLHGLPQRLRFDRDVRLWGAWTRDSYPSSLVRFLRAVEVEPVICPPRRPDKKPFVERCIGTLKHEWFARFSPATLAVYWNSFPTTTTVSAHIKGEPARTVHQMKPSRYYQRYRICPTV
jgi:hypothetical protein